MTEETRDTPPSGAPETRHDAPAGNVPSIDRAWDADRGDRAHRLKARAGDRSAHRLHHGLFEDLLALPGQKARGTADEPARDHAAI